MAAVAYFYVFKDASSQWRWRFVATNGKTLATGAEGYHNLADCEHGIAFMQRDCPGAVTIGDDSYKALRP
jgi:uncharacterized protein YegP (UPF0339 family)